MPLTTVLSNHWSRSGIELESAKVNSTDSAFVCTKASYAPIPVNVIILRKKVMLKQGVIYGRLSYMVCPYL